jgi:hypothetical protein
MANYCSVKSPSVATTSGRLSSQRGCDREIAKMKDQQSRKIRELKATLVASGFVTLDEQARALGLCRSSAWSILKGNHKNSGLSATTIHCLLRAPELPAAARAIILEYAEEKARGVYGHSKAQRRRFIARLSSDVVGRSDLEKHVWLEGEAVVANTAPAPDLETDLWDHVVQQDGPHPRRANVHSRKAR